MSNTTHNPMAAGNVAKVETITCGIVTTRYLGPTNTRPGRVKATSGSGKAVTVSWDHGLDCHENHAAAAAALVQEVLELAPNQITLVGGCLANDGYAFAILRK